MLKVYIIYFYLMQKKCIYYGQDQSHRNHLVKRKQYKQKLVKRTQYLYLETPFTCGLAIRSTPKKVGLHREIKKIYNLYHQNTPAKQRNVRNVISRNSFIVTGQYRKYSRAGIPHEESPFRPFVVMCNFRSGFAPVNSQKKIRVYLNVALLFAQFKRSRSYFICWKEEKALIQVQSQLYFNTPIILFNISYIHIDLFLKYLLRFLPRETFS